MVIKTFIRAIILLGVALAGTVPGSAWSVDYATLYSRISASVVTVNTRTFSTTAAGISVKPGIGTGILIQPTLVMTAAHVVDDANLVQVRFDDDTRIDASVIASVESSDIALLKLSEAPPNPIIAIMGDSDVAQIGSPVFIVGAPYGIEQTLSVGHLSGRIQRGEMSNGKPIEFLQTDTAINPGNSGGPMFNEQGEVIGIVSFILTKSGGFDGIGFASAINSAYTALMSSPSYVAGIDGLLLTPAQSRALSVPSSGILVQRVIPGSLASEWGLKAGSIEARIGEQEMLLGGDVILEIDCELCTQDAELMAVSTVAQHLSGKDDITVKIFREGQVVLLKKVSEPATTSDRATELTLLSR